MASRILLILLPVTVMAATDPRSYSDWVLGFERVDTNGDGTVSKGEFRDMMQDMGWALSLKQQADAFDAYDNDEPGNGFSLEEFIQMWNNTLVYSGGFSSNVPIDFQFAQFDINGDGAFVLAELIVGGYNAGRTVDMTPFFEAFDKYPKDGALNLCELYAGFTYTDWS